MGDCVINSHGDSGIVQIVLMPTKERIMCLNPALIKQLHTSAIFVT